MNGWNVATALAVGLTVMSPTAMAAENSLNAGDFNLTEYASVSNGYLVVDVPMGAPPGSYGASAILDLTPYERCALGASVRIAGENIAPTGNMCHGLKFMMHFKSAATGLDCWPDITRPTGSFAFTTFEMNDSLSGEMRSPTGLLFLGLQSTSGKAIFDLKSLKIVSGPSIYPHTNETYVIRYPTSVLSASRRRGVMLPALPCTEEDIRTLGEWGVTLARYQMVDAPRPEQGEDRKAYLLRYRDWLDGKLDHLEQRMIPWAAPYDIRFVVDLHTVPGGSENGESRIFHDTGYADAFVGVWRRIARRCCKLKGIYGYDLINEPNQLRKATTDYWNLQRRAAEAVREIDSKTPIIMEANVMDSPSGFGYLSPLAMDNVIYQVHMYEPYDYSHQGVHGEKGFVRIAYPTALHDRAYLEKMLKPVRDFEARHKAKIYVGEFSASAWAPGADRYIADCISIFENYGWDWTYHAFREWPGWSVEHEPVKEGVSSDCFSPSTDNPRKRALLAGLKGPGK